MTTGDFSTRLLLEEENFAGVLFQQGRVFLDRDGNAQTLLTNAWQDAAAADVIGTGLLAVPGDDPGAFQVDAAAIAGDGVDVTLRPGRAWADGLLVRLAGTPPVTRKATYLQPPVQSPPGDTGSIAAGVRDAVVLEVWREALSAFQVPDVLVEPALGGVDTTERLTTAFALRLYRMGADDTCRSIPLDDDVSSKGKLTASLQPTIVLAGDCPVVEGGGYTGFEHSLYRIEIARTNAGPTRFKWSQFNGGLVGRGVFDAVTRRVRITANFQAIMSSGLTDFYLETREYDSATGRWRVTYGAPVTINGTDLALPVTATYGAIPSSGSSVFFRLWNGIRPISDFPVSPNPTELHQGTGIRLEFEPEAPGKYVPEDFWTFVVRAGEIGNPQLLIDAKPPEGVRFHRVPIAVLEWDGTQTLSAGDKTIEDCRTVFQPLTKLSTCCTYRVGDGVNSHGDFTSIQEAIDHLPEEGGEVCVLPGTYNENVRIFRRHDVKVSGCGGRSLVRSVSEDDVDPVFHIVASANIVITHLAIEAARRGIGVLVDGRRGKRFAEDEIVELISDDTFPSATRGDRVVIGRVVGARMTRNVELSRLRIVAAERSAVEVRFAAEVSLLDSTIRMHDVRSQWPAVFFVGEDGRIEHNVITMMPHRKILDRLEAAYVDYASAGYATGAEAALGGIQIGGLSRRVEVFDNIVRGGVGNGITLGSVTIIGEEGEEGGWYGWWIDDDPCGPGTVWIGYDPGEPDTRRPVSAGPLEDIVIDKNHILEMGLNGIGVVGFFDQRESPEAIAVERLTIRNNEVRRCLWRPLAPIEDHMVDQMGYGGIALADVSRLTVDANLIEGNGPNHLEPICGVFVLHGEGIDVHDNRILDNGAKTAQDPSSAKQGRRGGIVAMLCSTPITIWKAEEGIGRDASGINALRVHENVVSAPLGPALWARARGPVSVHGNQLTSRGVVPRGARAGASEGHTVTLHNAGLGAIEQPEPMGYSSMKEGTYTTGASTSSKFIQPGVLGGILFSDNQVLLEIIEERKQETMLASVMLFSLDDIGVHANQFVCLLREGAKIMLNLMAYGFSLRASDNRFEERLGSAMYSGATLGVMNMTTDNQATHCLLIKGASGLTVDKPNTILVEALSKGYCEKQQRVMAGAFTKTVG